MISSKILANNDINNFSNWACNNELIMNVKAGKTEAEWSLEREGSSISSGHERQLVQIKILQHLTIT